MTRLIILRGYPGSGKTTVGKLLEKRGVGKFIDHNSILTFIAGIAGDDDGIYDDIAGLEQAIARKLLMQGSDVIVARGFSGLDSLRQYESLADSANATVVIFRLDVDPETLFERVSSHERKLDFNPTASKEALSVWMQDNPIQDHASEIVLDNTLKLDNVVDEILQKL